MNEKKTKEKLNHLITEQSFGGSVQKFDAIICQLKSKKKIFIYGAGGWGVNLCRLLGEYGIIVQGFFDKKAEKLKKVDQIPVFSLDQYEVSQEEKKQTFVLIAVRLEIQETVGSLLTKNGFVNWMSMNGIWHYGCWSNRQELFSLIKEKDYILNVSDLWSDSKSLDIYHRCIACYVTRKHDTTSQIDPGQYFPNDIKMQKGYDSFIDCGAYTGDTLEALTTHVGKVKKIVAFEPDSKNFKQLKAHITQNKSSMAESISLYQKGLWSSSQILFFEHAQGHNAHISNLGNMSLECVTLDEILLNWNPSFIKMDIEGAEIEAIKGAADIIKRCKPDLAISVYHDIEHLWQIPLLLRSLNKDYRFYLRAYEHFNQETILYVTGT